MNQCVHWVLYFNICGSCVAVYEKHKLCSAIIGFLDFVQCIKWMLNQLKSNLGSVLETQLFYGFRKIPTHDLILANFLFLFAHKLVSYYFWHSATWLWFNKCDHGQNGPNKIPFGSKFCYCFWQLPKRYHFHWAIYYFQD